VNLSKLRSSVVKLASLEKAITDVRDRVGNPMKVLVTP